MEYIGSGLHSLNGTCGKIDRDYWSNGPPVPAWRCRQWRQGGATPAGLIEIAEALLGVDFGREPCFVLAFQAAGEQSESYKREIAGMGRRTAANPSKTGGLPEPVRGTGCQIGTDGLLVTYNADVRP